MKQLKRHARCSLKALGLSAVLILAILTVWALAQRAYLIRVGDQRLAAVLAELDESEPGWRWEDVQARREVIPESENSANIVLAAVKLLPTHWPSPRQPQQQGAGTARLPSLQEQLDGTEPVRALDDELATDLHTELREVAASLAEARRLIGRPMGRYTVAWTTDFLSTPMNHVQEARRCAYLLGFDAVARAADKDYDGALASARGVLNAGRSLGDEPTAMSQLVRMACDAQAVDNMERVLAQGQVSKEELASASALLNDEASQNLWLIAVRGERAAALGVLRSFYTGELDTEKLTLGRHEPSKWANLSGWLYVRPAMHTCDGAALQYLTRLVHAAKSSADKKWKEVKAVDEEIRDIKAAKKYEFAVVVLLVPHLADLAEKVDCNQARLNCAMVGMALELYRLANGHWPETLDQLVPAPLARIPDDPFASGPLRYRRLADGVVVYSVGPDGEDNGGILARQNPKVPKTDLGFRLWDVASRRQPPAKKTGRTERPENDR